MKKLVFLFLLAGCHEQCVRTHPGYHEFLRECLAHLASDWNGSTPCYWRAHELGLAEYVDCRSEK